MVNSGLVHRKFLFFFFFPSPHDAKLTPRRRRRKALLSHAHTKKRNSNGMQYSPGKKGFERSWAMRVAKKDLWFMLTMVNGFLLSPNKFLGFSVPMSENRWTDWCRVGDCCSRKRRANWWYFREFTGRVVGLGRSWRSFLPHRWKRSC